MSFKSDASWIWVVCRVKKKWYDFCWRGWLLMSLFSTMMEFVYQKFIPHGKVGISIFMQIFCDILRNVARALWKPVQWRLISFSTTTLTVLFVARNHMTVILHPLSSPDLAPSLFLYPKVNSILKKDLVISLWSRKAADYSCRFLNRGLLQMLPTVAESSDLLY
jgi:hypothetical protein